MSEKKKTMTAVVVRPRKYAQIEQIDSSLSGMQKLVGGYIETLSPENGVYYVFNDNGKNESLPMNRAIYNSDGDLFDIIHGTFFICGEAECDFASLSPCQLNKYRDMFKVPEQFFVMNGNVCIIK